MKILPGSSVLFYRWNLYHPVPDAHSRTLAPNNNGKTYKDIAITFPCWPRQFIIFFTIKDITLTHVVVLTKREQP